MAVPESEVKAINIEKFRGLVRNYLERHHYEAAVFWGDKVVTLSEGDPIDVYWLVQAYIHTQQYHRACLLINTHNLAGNGSLCYLSALCHFKVQEYQAALNLLEAPFWPVSDGLSGGCAPMKGGCSSRPVPALDDILSLETSRQLLRAKIYEATDNPNQASECYQAALVADPLCYDALKALTDHHMLSLQEERDLHASLPLATRCDTQQQADLVRVCYQTKLNRCAVTMPCPPTSTTTDNSPALPVLNKAPIDLDNLPLSVSSLANNLDILTARAESLYYKCNFMSCFQLTRTVLEQDPYHTECLPIHIACLIELEQSNSLFLLAHKLVDLYPETALAWFAVGAYYYLIGKNEHARRYLSKATSIDKVFGPAWIAFAHSFAAENEHDQASAAYFKAAQLMKGSHLPLLYIGMEYSLTNNPKFAEKFFQKAAEMAPDDPFVLHELGVVNFSNQQYESAEVYFSRAVRVVNGLYGETNNYYNIPTKWTTLLNNLGHTLRKRGKYREALQYHQQAIRLLPNDASAFTALALCLGLLGELEEAIEALHNSLSLHRDQTVATTLLNTLLDQLANIDKPFPDDDENVSCPEYTNLLERISVSGSAPRNHYPARGPRPCASASASDDHHQAPARPPLATLIRRPSTPVRHAITSKSTTDGRASQRTLQSNLDSDAESTYLPSESSDVHPGSETPPSVSGMREVGSPDPGNLSNRSLLSIENMVMDEDSD